MLNYYTSEGVQPRLWYQYDRAGCPTTTAIATTAVTSTITTFDHLAVKGVIIDLTHALISSLCRP